MSNVDADSKLSSPNVTQRRIWFRVEQVEIRWLPFNESAFLLWVLAVLLVAWLGIGAALGLV